MYSKFQLIKKYVRYFFTAANSKGHGIHPPFVFDFVTNVLTDNRQFYAYTSIEQLRKQLLLDNRLLTIEDFGAGSRIHKSNQRAVSAVAKSSLKPKKYSQLLFRMIDYYQPKTILELGTSLGVTTSYLASAKPNAQVITMEGANAVAQVAQENFANLELQNIQIIVGNFDTTLPLLAKSLPTSIDFAFLDGNHRYQPTIDYFNNLLPKLHNYSTVVLDDIHWSSEMEQAWHEIQQHPAVTLTIDLFFIGLVFFRTEQQQKQHFSIRF